MTAVPVRRPRAETEDDCVLPFAVEPLDVRGRVVRLGPALDELLANHGYPDAVARLVAEGKEARRGETGDRQARPAQQPGGARDAARLELADGDADGGGAGDRKRLDVALERPGERRDLAH